MNSANDELNKFKQKIKEKEQFVYVTLTDPSKNKINFTIKNESTFYRARTLLTKEPITIDWIKNFNKLKDIYSNLMNIYNYDNK